jgi:hypothetical protein
MSDAIKIDTKNIKDVISDNQRAHILASLNNGTLYVPKQGSGVKVKPEFFTAAAGQTHEMELLKVEALSLNGRNDKAGMPTSDSVYKVTCEVQIGQITSPIKLHLCDVLPLMATGKAIFSFSIYETGGNKYLVPQAKERFSSAQIAEFFSK